MNSLVSAYLAFWTRAFDFSGRTKRIDFWLAFITSQVIYLGLLLISLNVEALAFLGSILTLYAVASIIPTWALFARRLRDLGKEGAWVLLLLIPIIGLIWLLVLSFGPSIPA